MDYRVELDVYHGPMDLLLHLIKRDELDIYDIPIARITDGYFEYLAMLKKMTAEDGLDINLAGDFLVMAATLMEIKSAMLLPKPPPVEGQTDAAAELTDPRYELVQKLLEYKRFKDAATALDHRQHEHQGRYPRQPARLEGEADEPPPVDLDEVQIWDLLDAFSRLMREVGTRKPRYHEVTYDDTPIDLHAADIEDRLTREGVLSLRQLVTGRRSKSEMIGVFLALLELIREKKILVTQSEPLGDVEIRPAPEEHRKTYAQASLHLADEAEADAKAAMEEANHPEQHSREAEESIDSAESIMEEVGPHPKSAARDSHASAVAPAGIAESVDASESPEAADHESRDESDHESNADESDADAEPAGA